MTIIKDTRTGGDMFVQTALTVVSRLLRYRICDILAMSDRHAIAQK